MSGMTGVTPAWMLTASATNEPRYIVKDAVEHTCCYVSMVVDQVEDIEICVCHSEDHANLIASTLNAFEKNGVPK